MRNMDITKDSIDNVIAEFCHEVMSDPLCFFSEADLQGILYAKLINVFPRLIETAVSRGPDSKGKYKTGLIHREYGAENSRRIDISVFDPQDLARIDSLSLKSKGKYLRPRFAVELGTEKTRDADKHIKGDLKKLSERSLERGYLIHVFRDTSLADTNTKTRNKTEAKIERIYRDPARAAELPDNVSYLCFVLRLLRKTKRIGSKCQLLNPVTGEWKRINLNDVRARVLDILKQ